MPTAAKAATLTGDQELTYASWPIEKWEEQPDGSLTVYGKATTGEVDADEQIVDPDWSAKALQEWFDTGPNLRVQHNPQRDPAGSGLKVELDRDGDGAHWVKSRVDEPVAVRLVKGGHLRAYSVGISRPQIVPDPTGKARGGIIKGGKFAEVSLVDRPANASCTLQLVKAAGDDGHAEWTGKLDGDEDILAKGAEPDLIKGTVAFKPSDLAKLLDLRGELEKSAAPGDQDGKDSKDTPAGDSEDDDSGGDEEWSGDGEDKAAAPGAEKRDFSAARRRELADQGHALPDGSYPIETAADLGPAATLARSGHGNAEGAKKLIARRAKELGAANPLDSGKTAKGDCKLCRGTGKIRDGAMGCPDCEGSGDKAAAGEGEAAEPDLAKGAGRACTDCGKGGHGDGDKFCPGCGTKLPAMDAAKAARPNPGDGVTGEHTDPVPEHREPDGPAVESFEHDAGLPTVPDGDVAVKTLLRAKSLGVPPEEARLHDLLCPAYHPDDVAACHPGANLASAVDGGGWQGKALTATASAPLEMAQAAMHLWQHAETIKATSPEDLTDLRWDGFKSFMDAQSGPGSFPVPSELTATRFTRPLITPGHQATAPGSGEPRHGGVPAGQASAAQFGRDYTEAGHAADSPQNTGQPGPAVTPPSQTGRPTRMFYRNTAKDQARQAMLAMHDHIAQTFPDLCPMHGPGMAGEPPAGARPVPVGKTAQPGTGAPQAVPEPAAEGTGPAEVTKAAGDTERARLAEAVLSGDVTLASARLALGVEVPKALAPAEYVAELVQGPDIASVVADAVTKAVAPLTTKIAEQQKQLDDMADQPDPYTAPWRGGALPAALKALSPAPGGQETAAMAQDRARAALQQELLETARCSPDPADREAAYSALFKMGGFPDMTKAHPLT